MAAARATASCPTGPQSGRWCASTSHDRQILSRRRAVRADARLELYDLCVPRGPPVEGGRAGAEADGGVADGEGFQATRHAVPRTVGRPLQLQHRTIPPADA